MGAQSVGDSGDATGHGTRGDRVCGALMREFSAFFGQNSPITGSMGSRRSSTPIGIDSTNARAAQVKVQVLEAPGFDRGDVAGLLFGFATSWAALVGVTRARSGAARRTVHRPGAVPRDRPRAPRRHR
jgi:hypothetical protein